MRSNYTGQYHYFQLCQHLIPNHQFGFRQQHSTIDEVHRITDVIENAVEKETDLQCCNIPRCGSSLPQSLARGINPQVKEILTE